MKPYEDLREVLNGKEYHIVTTNQDQRFYRVFPEERISAIQGDFGYLHCSRPYHDGPYSSCDIMHRPKDSINIDLKIPSELLPRCPRCGELMEPWAGSKVFLEGERYHNEYAKLDTFIRSHADERLLFLELGVKRMTPMFIQQPFWNMTHSLPRSRYTTVNVKDALYPPEIADRNLAVRDDIAKVLSSLRKLLEL